MVTRIKPPRQQTTVEVKGIRPHAPPPPLPPVPPPPAISPLIDDQQTAAHRVWSSERTAAEIEAHTPNLSSTQW